MNLDRATRPELETIILENDLGYLFGGLEQAINTETEVLREKIGEWVFEGDETMKIKEVA